MSEYLAWVRAVFVCFNVLHQHTHTYLGPDPAVGLEPRADKYGPALTSSRRARVWTVDVVMGAFPSKGGFWEDPGPACTHRCFANNSYTHTTSLT